MFMENFLRDSDEYGQTRFFVARRKKRMGNTNHKGGKREKERERERERMKMSPEAA